MDDTRRGNTLRIGHINVRSIMSSDKIDGVRLLLEKEHLDCLCISETWASPGNPADSILLFPGFKIHRFDRQMPRRGRRVARGGGVAIVLREELSASRLDTTSDPAGRLETLWLSVTGRGTRSAVLGAAYRPPDSPAGALTDLRDQLEGIISLNKPLFLLGDFNLDTLDHNKPGVRQYVTMLHDLGLHQLIQQPTHPAATPSLIDHIITNIPGISQHAKVVPSHISDHDLVFLDAPFPRVKPARRQITVRSTKDTDFNHLKLDLLLADWDPVYRAASTDNKYAEFLNIWNTHVDAHCPLKTISFRRPECPWLSGSEELRNLQSTRDAARRERDVTGTDEANQRYRALKREFTGRLRKAKADFFRPDNTETSKKTWSKLKKYAIANKSAKSNSIQGSTAADRFNEYFATVGQRIADALNNEPSPDLPLRLPRVVSGAFRVKPVTLPELSLALHRMSSSKAVGPDNVCIALIRECFAVVGPHLLHILNHSFTSGRVPLIWKQATVVPLHKGGSVTEPCNFRPISVLSVVGKLAERIVCTQLLEYATSHHILADSQYAYRPHHSTEHAIIDIVSHINNNMDAGKVTTISSTDLSKAFDCVDRAALLAKLECYGIAPHWFSDYFTDRRQTVKGGNAPSLEITYGVVQGSIVGPLMFLLFTNDIQCYVSNACKLVSYADDMQLMHNSVPSPSGLAQLRTQVEADLAAASAWYRHNGLKINPSKTEFIVIGTQSNVRKAAELKVTFQNSQLSPSESVKILGILIDSTLSWQHQTAQIAQRCFGLLIAINKLKHMLPRSTTKMLIESLVFPHIRYCLPAWAPTTVTQRQRVEKAINFAVRVVAGLRRRDHVSQSREQLEWLSFEQTVALCDCSCLHRIINVPDGPRAVRDLVSRRSEVSERHTRAAADRTVLQTSVTRHPRLESVKKAFPNRAVTTWNRLPSATRHCLRFNAFKGKAISFIRAHV